jgi:hypothetical protein
LISQRSRQQGNLNSISAVFFNSFFAQFFTISLVIFHTEYIHADEQIPFSEIQISTPTFEAGTLEHQFGIYSFSVGWQGIGAAKAWVSIRPNGDTLQVRTVARTNSFVDLFYKMRFESFSSVGAKDFRPRNTRIRHQENSKVKNLNIEFQGPRRVKSRQDRNDRTREEFIFDPKNDMLDPFSAMLLARSLEWKKGQERQFDVFTGKSRYLVTLRVVDEKVIDVLGKKRDCWVVSPKVKKLNEKNPKKKLRSARIYVSKDKSREVLLLESEVFIGTVKAKLVSYDAFPAEQLEKPSVSPTPIQANS